MREIHILLSRESWEEMRDLNAQLDLDRVAHILGGRTFAEAHGSSYEEYLERERKNPTTALFG